MNRGLSERILAETECLGTVLIPRESIEKLNDRLLIEAVVDQDDFVERAWYEVLESIHKLLEVVRLDSVVLQEQHLVLNLVQNWQW